MKRLLSAIGIVFCLAQCGRLEESVGAPIVARFFPSSTPTATQTATITQTPTVTVTPSITPTPTCEELGRTWARTVFVPGLQEFQIIHTTKSIDEWFAHYNEYVRLVEDKPPPACAPVLGRAYETLRNAVYLNRMFEKDALLGKDLSDTAAFVIVFQYPGAVKKLTDYAEVVQKQYHP